MPLRIRGRLKAGFPGVGECFGVPALPGQRERMGPAWLVVFGAELNPTVRYVLEFLKLSSID